MITSNHDMYLKTQLEPDNGYPHQELYEHSDIYVWLHEYNSTCYDEYAWKDRYSRLKQNTQFFKNICNVVGLVLASSSVEELKMRFDLMMISQEVSNFIICYIWMCPGKWFSYDWRNSPPDRIDNNDNERASWNVVESMHREIVDENLPMLEVEDFLKMKI